MISRLGLLVSRAFARTAPDPFVIAIGLTIITALLALVWGDFRVEMRPAVRDRAVALLDAWRSDETGFWRFLAFGMQMSLILVTGHALAAARPVRRVIEALARLPRSTASAAAMVSAVACVAGLLNWGLGLIVGALLARDVGRALHQRGIRAHYPLIAAAGYSTMLLWHGGLSGSAPLTMTTVGAAQNVISAEMIERITEGASALAPDAQLVGLDQTIGSGLNMLVTGGLLIGVPALLLLMAPRREQDMVGIEQFWPLESAVPSNEKPYLELGTQNSELPDKLDRSPIVAWLLALPLLIAVARYAQVSGLGAVGLNTVNMFMLALGLILHSSPRAYMEAAMEGARGCAGILIQFPIYGGIMGMMHAAGLVEKLALAFAAIGNETTMPVLSFLAAGVVNLFVPSGGGQWAIQGPVAIESGLAVGVAPAKMIMAVAYGDQLTNMLQPFWALPLLGITGVRARDIVGYTTIVMFAAMVWIGAVLLVW